MAWFPSRCSPGLPSHLPLGLAEPSWPQSARDPETRWMWLWFFHHLVCYQKSGGKESHALHNSYVSPLWQYSSSKVHQRKLAVPALWLFIAHPTPHPLGCDSFSLALLLLGKEKTLPSFCWGSKEENILLEMKGTPFPVWGNEWVVGSESSPFWSPDFFLVRFPFIGFHSIKLWFY